MKKRFFRYHRALPFLLAFFFVSLPLTLLIAHAQGDGKSISGDEICGQWDPVSQKIKNPCTIDVLVVVTKRLLTYVIGIGLPLLVVFIAYRFVMAWFALQRGESGAYKEALKKSWSATWGFFLIVALFGGVMYVMLKYLGVKDGPLQLLEKFSEALIPHAYAQSAPAPQYLPNFLGVNNLFDFILQILRLIMRFFVYPALIAMWVWTGFGFVLAQGNPDALNKAKKWLLYAFLTTLVIFMIQGFLLAAQATVKKILPGVPGPTATAPSRAELQASCNAQGGALSSDGKCYGALDAAALKARKDCTGKDADTVCYVTQSSGPDKIGTCTDAGGTMQCTIAQEGARCVTSADIPGKIGTSNNCDLGPRPLTGRDGSCQYDAQCSPLLKCTNGTCQR